MICLRYLGHNPGSTGRVQARVTSKVSSEIHSHIYKQKTVTLPVFCTQHTTSSLSSHNKNTMPDAPWQKHRPIKNLSHCLDEFGVTLQEGTNSFWAVNSLHFYK